MSYSSLWGHLEFSMIKFLIVGHPQAGNEHVAQIMANAGIAASNPSRIQNLTLAQINEAIIKGEGGALDELVDGTPLPQLKPAPIWQNLAIDLFLGNADFPFCMSCDPLSVYLLDYWKAQSERVFFLFVYDEPCSIYADVLQGASVLPLEEVERRADFWLSYNRTMLAFFRENKKNCLMISRGGAQASPLRFRQSLEDLVGLSIEASIMKECAVDLERTSEQATESRQLQPETLAHELTRRLVSTRYEMANLHQELQAAAGSLADFVADQKVAMSAYDAWQAYITEQQRGRELAQDNRELRHQVRSLKRSRDDIESKARQWEARVLDVDGELAKVDRERSLLEREVSMLFRQLSQAQEEFENFILRAADEGEALPKSIPTVYYGAADRIKQQLAYRLGATMIEHSRSIRGVFAMPYALFRTVRTYRRNISVDHQLELPPISDYADAAEAEKVKKHLSYRLGVVVLDRIKKPWLWVSIPFAIIGQKRIYKKEKMKQL